jgi:hypothetical protein
MAVTDIGAQVKALALDEAGKQCFTEDFGVDVTWAPQGIQTPQGVQPVPGWTLLLTARNPFLGEGPLFHMVPLQATVPDEAMIREAVADGIRQLRDLAASRLASVNGGARVPLARGSA